MVTSVSNNSANILTLFQTGKDAAKAGNEEALAKIQELAKDAEQMKASASPAQTQGASVATKAWIEWREAVDQIKAMGSSPLVEIMARSVALSKHPTSKWGAIQDPVQLAHVIQEYNGNLRGGARIEAQLEESKALLAAATNENEIERLTKKVELDTRIVARADEVRAEFPDRIEKAVQEMNDKWNVSGSLIVKNDDGTYGISAFRVRLKDNNGSLYYSNGDGTILTQQNQFAGKPDVWATAVSLNENGTMIFNPNVR